MLSSGERCLEQQRARPVLLENVERASCRLGALRSCAAANARCAHERVVRALAGCDHERWQRRPALQARERVRCVGPGRRGEPADKHRMRRAAVLFQGSQRRVRSQGTKPVRVRLASRCIRKLLIAASPPPLEPRIAAFRRRAASFRTQPATLANAAVSATATRAAAAKHAP